MYLYSYRGDVPDWAALPLEPNDAGEPAVKAEKSILAITNVTALVFAGKSLSFHWMNPHTKAVLRTLSHHVEFGVYVHFDEIKFSLLNPILYSRKEVKEERCPWTCIAPVSLGLAAIFLSGLVHVGGCVVALHALYVEDAAIGPGLIRI